MNESPDPREALERLIEHFEQNLYAIKSPQYNETQARLEFINPLFTLLGWDMDNRQGYAEAYKDVIHEDAIKVGGYTKAPDYCFRIGGTRKFFVEAKKPSVNIKDDPEPAYQLRRYAWSAKLPLSILTDFQELAVYDCRVKPAPTDKASAGRIRYITYSDYAKEWDSLASVFSREAVLKGSFDKYVESNKAKRGTAEVDAAFLKEIEAWRDALARNLALRNPNLTTRELNFAVQVTIDRIIFLRICEDRGVEDYARLMALQNGPDVYPRLMGLFRSADERYNSGLFHFEPEKGREGHDTLTPSLSVDDKVLKEILKGLYYPDSPYEFSVLPADILGQVYEQFLGKVIRLTAGHQAKVEDKPEVKKAGGVYYTPTYIVDYIVKNTVGKMLEGKTPKEVSGETPKGAHPLRIADIGCGSGSFLLGAYQYLLTWYLDRYIEEGAEKWAKGKEPRLYQASGGEWKLTTSERKRILLTHIYGVDIDPQAVEVTKLSLLLKVLEGETKESVSIQRRLFHERALPDLSKNIKCGNSLIGSDFYKGEQGGLFGDDEERDRINAFDWEVEFPEVFRVREKPVARDKGKAVTTEDAESAEKGFDVVIGNPPYVYRNATEGLLRDYYQTNYSCAEGNYELYKFFLERAIGLLGEGGLVGMIVSSSFLVQSSFAKLRHLLLERSAIQHLAPLGPGVFKGATVDTVVLVSKRVMPPIGHRIIVQSPCPPVDLPVCPTTLTAQSRFAENEGLVFDYRLSNAAADLSKRLFSDFPAIEQSYELGVGINTGFIRADLVADSRIDDRYHPLVVGSGISRYGQPSTSGWIMYDKKYVASCGKRGRSLPPARFFEEPKLLIVRTRNLSLTRRLVATLDAEHLYNLNRLSNIIARGEWPIEGLLGFLNSTLFNWIFSTKFYDYEIKPIYLRTCPVANACDPRLNAAVSGMLDLNNRLPLAKTAHDRTLIERQIAATDKEIDRLVYDLYGLTDDEIAIVEEGTATK